MSFISSVEQGKVYAPGWFLAHEECVRKTREIPAEGASTAANGGKYVKMGTVYPSYDANAVGIVYEDVDVTNGDMPGSVVLKGFVYEDRLPQAVDTYDSATVTSADNPNTKGWYEEDGDDSYKASTDTIAVKGKNYYTQGGSSPSYTYTKVTTIEYGDDPEALGLYERSGSSPNYVYTLSTDTQADGSKTYYEMIGKQISSTVKNALITAGIQFI